MNSVTCKAEDCDREFDDIHAMHTHYGIEHGDPLGSGRPVELSARDDLIDAHPKMETIGVVDMSFDDQVSADHIRLYRWYETTDRETRSEYRIAKFKDNTVIQGSEWMEIPPTYTDDVIDMLLEVDLDV